MDIPKNCSECPYTSVCHAPHYGGSRCQYEKEINSMRIQEILADKPKD